MPRQPRAFVPGLPHHLVHRGHNRQPVFLAEEDFHVYLANLEELKRALNVRIHAFCLMTNHVHLIAQPEVQGTDLSDFMKILSGKQTRYLNRVEERTGTLWEGRFKASLIDTERYLLACCRYVDLNPVRAAIVARPEEYPWSSYRARAGYGANGVRFDRDPCYLALGTTPAERQRQYREFVEEGIAPGELELIRRAVRRNQLTGDAAFVDAVASRVGWRISRRGPGRPPHPRKNRSDPIYRGRLRRKGNK